MFDIKRMAKKYCTRCSENFTSISDLHLRNTVIYRL